MPLRPARTLIAAVAVLAACGTLPDRTARAPVLEGFGTLDWRLPGVDTAAQQAFTRGVLQAYAFNEKEAVRQFKAALALDPRCAMCAWGVAWQLGPNINNPSRSGSEEALRYVGLALRLADRATPRERALIDALAVRYGHASQIRDTAPLLERCGPTGDAPHPLDVAYAARLRVLADAWPDDADVTSLYAEAELIATDGDWWDAKTGEPGGRVGDVALRLEHALVLQPAHTGLNHYLIHATDADGVAPRALAAADRLGALAPASPHLVHMPSHTYGRVGRFADAVRVNEKAVDADLVLAQVQKAQGFEPSHDWRSHNQHFLWYAALMEGRGDLALATARDSASRARPANGYRRALPVLALLRLERWQAVLDEPPPSSEERGMGLVLVAHARGIAAARLGRLDDARAALPRAEEGAAQVAKAFAGNGDNERALRDLAASAVARLAAEVALAEGRVDDALARQVDATRLQAAADDFEPPMLAAGGAVALGDLQRRAGRWADAERSFRERLALQPHDGWALDGLVRTLRAAGRNAEADALRPRLDAAWARADAALRQRS